MHSAHAPYLAECGQLWQASIPHHKHISNMLIAMCELLTFISALESSPVHCLNPRPSGKCHSAGKDSVAAILVKNTCLSEFAVA